MHTYVNSYEWYTYVCMYVSEILTKQGRLKRTGDWHHRWHLEFRTNKQV